MRLSFPDTYPLYLYLPKGVFEDLEIIGTSEGLEPEDVGEMTMKLGLQVLLSTDHAYGKTDLGSGPIELGSFDDPSLSSMVRTMRRRLQEEDLYYRLGWQQYYTQRLKAAVMKIVTRWGHRKAV